MRNKYKKPSYSIIDGTVTLLEDWVTPYGRVPKGADSNGADIPWFLKPIISPFGCLLIPSIHHDYLYKNAIGSKGYADWAFKQIGLDFNVSRCIMYPAYFLVKHFGKGNY